MIPKPLDTCVPIMPVFAERYSGVSFDPARPVERAQLLALSEAARWSPSCFGDQPWRLLICDKSSNPAAWDKAFACLMEGNQGWCRNAPVLVISCCDTLLTRNDKPNPFGAYDTGAAALAFSLQAASMGLMTHQMGGFVGDKARELFSIPERYRPLAMMALGYQLPQEQLPDAQRERELAPRERAALGTRFFAGEWNKGI